MHSKSYTIDKEALYQFQAGLWDKVKMQMRVQRPWTFEAACKIVDHMGSILLNM